MGEPNSTSAIQDVDLVDRLLIDDEHPTLTEIRERGLDVKFLRKKLDLLMPHLPYLSGYTKVKWLRDSSLHGGEQKDAWERGAEKAGFSDKLALRLGESGLGMRIKGSHKEHVVILLTREGKWIHVRVPVSDPEATSLRFEQHRSVEDLCEWVARLVETAGYEDYFSYSEPFAVELGRSLDKLLESSIEDKEGRIKAQKLALENSLALNVRLFGTPGHEYQKRLGGW